MYTLRFLETYPLTHKKLIKGTTKKEKQLKKALKCLQLDPFYPSLKTHKVNTIHFGKRFSSWISGDLRIIWDYDEENKLVILLLAIASHSGTHKAYK